MTDPDAKQKILSRRAKFLAAALASAGVVGCDQNDVPTNPSIYGAADTGAAVDATDADADDADGAPTPCLTAPADSAVEDTAGDADDTGPTPCLVPELDAGDDGG